MTDSGGLFFGESEEGAAVSPRPPEPADSVPVYGIPSASASAAGEPMAGDEPVAAGSASASGAVGGSVAAGAPTWPASGRSRRVIRAIAITVLVIIGIGGATAGGFALIHEMSRKATKAELAAASNAEVARRWRQYPAGTIFPAKVTYTMPDGTVTATARLVGIAPQATCAEAADSAVGSVLRKYHCASVLRATYTDESGTLLTTIGVAVMRDRRAAFLAAGEIDAEKGLRPVGFGGTIASGFTDSGVLYSSSSEAGPYLVIVVGGVADGRTAITASSGFPEPDFAEGIASSVRSGLTRKIEPCRAVDVQC